MAESALYEDGGARHGTVEDHERNGSRFFSSYRRPVDGGKRWANSSAIAADAQDAGISSSNFRQASMSRPLEQINFEKVEWGIWSR